MDVGKVLAALRQERAQIEEVIANLERLEQSRDRRRGRPPAIFSAGPRKRGRPRGSKNRISLRAAGLLTGVGQPQPRVMAAGQTAGSDDNSGISELM